MFDGITIKYTIENFAEWKETANLQFDVGVFLDDAEIKTKQRDFITITTYRAKWETFYLIVREVENRYTNTTNYYLTLKGSLHKNYYAGKNFLPFTWQMLQQQVNHICKTLSIDAKTAQISTLEIGVNIITRFEVTPFLRQNIVSYKGNPFNRYKPDRNGFCLGIYCTLSQYEVKIYDKGLQNNLPYNLLRFEKRYLKMQVLNKRGIKYLTDLLSFEKVNTLLPLLLEGWNNVLIYDIETGLNRSKPDTIKKAEIELMNNGQNAKFWEKLKSEKSNSTYFEKIKTFKTLVAKFGNNWQKLTKKLIENEWKELTKNRTNLPCGIDVINKKETDKFTIKIKGNNVRQSFCLSCGREITHQKKGSKYCSAKDVGEAAAHQCRNSNSNPKNNLKNKIKRIESRGVLFAIAPYVIKRQKTG